MSPRARVAAIVAVVACLAAGAVVGVVVLQTRGEQTGRVGVGKPLKGPPPLRLDLGVRVDPEAQALRRAETLYAQGRRAAAARLFERSDSVEARIGAAFARWPDDSLDAVKALVAAHPNDPDALLHLGIAYLWAGRTADAARTLRTARRRYPDAKAAVDAGDFLYSGPPGVPEFVPTFAPPASITRLPPPQQLAALARAARRPDARAKLLYGTTLQFLGHQVSAERQFAAAARLAPHDPEARVAAVLGTFDKAHPQRVFPRLGPLVKEFPHAATVRFHLGLALFWISQVREAERQLRLVVEEAPRSPLAKQARTLLTELGHPRTK